MAIVLLHRSGSSISLCADGFFINQRQANRLLSFMGLGKLWQLCFPAWVFESSSRYLVVAFLVAMSQSECSQ